MTLKEKEQKAIEALKTFEPEDEPYYLCYSGGNGRIGCIGCPMQNKKGMRKAFQRYPKYYYNYIKAFDNLVKVLQEKGSNPRWKNGLEVMRWWVSDINEIEGQTLFEGFDLLDV